MVSFYVFCFCLFLTYAMYLLATRGSDARRAHLEQRLEKALLYSAQTDNAEVRLARDDLMSEIPWLNRILIRIEIATRLKRILDQADLQISVGRLVILSLIAGICAGFAASMLTLYYPLMIIVGVIAAAAPFMHVIWKRKKRINKFLEKLPDALDLMSRALAAGHAFPEALHMVSTEMPEPIAGEFRKTYQEQNLGLSLKLALENLSHRIPLLDLRMCITGILIQKETGGNLAEILEKIAYTIRDRFRIMEDVKTLTAQSRIGAWILCGLPVFVALALTAVNPEYMDVLWNDPRGHKVIAAALFFQTGGMLLVRKIIRIKI